MTSAYVILAIVFVASYFIYSSVRKRNKNSSIKLPEPNSSLKDTGFGNLLIHTDFEREGLYDEAEEYKRLAQLPVTRDLSASEDELVKEKRSVFQERMVSCLDKIKNANTEHNHALIGKLIKERQSFEKDYSAFMKQFYAPEKDRKNMEKMISFLENLKNKYEDTTSDIFIVKIDHTIKTIKEKFGDNTQVNEV